MGFKYDNMKDKWVIGIDFGTDSARAILVETATGEILTKAVSEFSRWKKGLYCDAELDQYRQHPLDYIEAIDDLLENLLKDIAVADRKNIVAIGSNTTGSTPVAVDENVLPLAMQEEFKDNPNAMFILWKDHTAIKEADEINSLAKKWKVDYTLYSGGIYSSEWFWSKILYVNRRDSRVKEQAFSWMEQSDWVPAYLSGVKKLSDVKRNRCAAGHKAMWNEQHGGLPSKEFLCSLDPSFYQLNNRFYTKTYTSNEVFGNIAPYFVDKFELSPDTKITVGGIDAHHGAIGAGIQPYALIKVVGTSTCDMLTVPKGVAPPLVDGICGQVDGSIDPDTVGFEAGQSAFGDVYRWFRDMLLKSVFEMSGENIDKQHKQYLEDNFLSYLSDKAALLSVKEDDLVFTDYFNGRRTPDADFTIKSAAMGFSLATGAEHVFKALVEGTAFGSKAIIERFQSAGIAINEVIATGGIANRSPYVMQVLADVLNFEVKVVDSDQTCALGAAVFAATAAGLFENVQKAKRNLSAAVNKNYIPNASKQEIYNILYKKYKTLSRLNYE